MPHPMIEPQVICMFILTLTEEIHSYHHYCDAPIYLQLLNSYTFFIINCGNLHLHTLITIHSTNIMTIGTTVYGNSHGAFAYAINAINNDR